MDTTQSAPQQQPTLAREIRLWDGVALVVGGIIGSGIFLVPRDVSQQLDSFAGVLLVWLFGGLLSLAGALSLGELGGALPRTGGLYVYLREAYGPWAGFLYGWASFTAINTGTIASLGAGFGLYMSQLVPLGANGQKAMAVGSILLLTWVNCIGLRHGTRLGNISTLAKVAGLGLVVVLLLWRGRPLEAWSASFWPTNGASLALVPFGAALVAVLWAYEGWHTVTFSAGEYREPARDLPRSLAIGTASIVAIYMLANLAYYAVLPGSEVAQTEAVAAGAIVKAVGPAASVFISLLIVVSIFGANNATILLGPRVLYAMAHEGLFFKLFARVHPRYRTPVLAIIAQGIWASILAMVGTFQQLFTYVVFTHWVFYAAAVAGVIVLRKKRPELARPYRVPGYPFVPIAFVLAAAGLTVSTIAASPVQALAGIGFVFLGIPVYLLFRRALLRSGSPASAPLE